MTIFPLKTSWLRAALVFGGVNQAARPYLNTVLLETDEKGLYVVATDGKRMLVFFDAVGAGSEDRQYLIHRADVELATKAKDDVLIFCEDDGAVTFDDRKITLSTDTFVPWRSALPCAPNGDKAQFNSTLLADCSKVGKLIDENSKHRDDYGSCEIKHNGASAALLQWFGCPACVGVLMPMSIKSQQIPNWLPRP